MEIKKALTDSDLDKCWQTMHVLRDKLSKDKFMHMVSEMKKETYEILYIEENQIAVAVMGYRFITMLYAGKIIVVDDLVTAPDFRGKGYATALLDYIINYAKENQCDGVHLDSAHHRYEAHRLYMNKGFKILGYHFILDFRS